jgi:hypothetical protein
VARRKRKRKRPRVRERDKERMMEMTMEMMLMRRTERERARGMRGWKVMISERTARRIGTRIRFETLDLYAVLPIVLHFCHFCLPPLFPSLPFPLPLSHYHPHTLQGIIDEEDDDDDASVSMFTTEGVEEKGEQMEEENEASSILAPSASSSSSSSSAAVMGTRNTGVSPGERKGRMRSSGSAERGNKHRGRREEVVSDEEGEGEGEGEGESAGEGEGGPLGRRDPEGEGYHDLEGSVSIYSIGSDEEDDGCLDREDLVIERVLYP